VALERVAEVKPDLVLLDLMMPEMDGFQFLAELRARPEWKALPVVVLSAMTLTAEDHRRLHGSVEKVLQKGACSMAELETELEAALMVTPGSCGRSRSSPFPAG
jgi:CheY-like chemotaxis protein